MPLSPLPASFYNRPVVDVARDLLGMRLVRQLDGCRVAGLISETEAYAGESDLACHARAGRTPRTEPLYGPPGRAYVYFIYGIHWMLNCVAEPSGQPAAVLIRAIHPTEGQETLVRRGHKAPNWFTSPARLCKALEIDGRFNSIDLTNQSNGLWVEPGQPLQSDAVTAGPRIGIDNVPEPWRSQPWRFRANGILQHQPPDSE